MTTDRTAAGAAAAAGGRVPVLVVGEGAAGTGYVPWPGTGRQRTFYPTGSSRRAGGPSRMLTTMTPARPDGPVVAEPALRAVLADAAGWYRGQLLAGAGAEAAVGLLRGRGLIDLRWTPRPGSSGSSSPPPVGSAGTCSPATSKASGTPTR